MRVIFQDTGIKAIVSGLVIAQSRMLLASSLNDPATKESPEAAECQKPFSGYIQLIVKWRTDVFRRPADSVVRLFPFGDAVASTPATTTDIESVAERDRNEDIESDVEHVGEGAEGEQEKEKNGQGGGGGMVEVQ